MNKHIHILALTLVLALAACAPRTLTVMTHDSFAVSEEVVLAFEQETGIEVSFLSSGDTGTALNKAILSKDNPLADVFYGVDNTFLSRALDEDIFLPYDSPLLAEIPAGFKLDPQNRALPVDYGDVCLNYDLAYFSENNLPPPQSLEDLLKPEYKSLLVVQNPATSSPGLAFLLATIGRFGPDGYLDYWQALKSNDVLVVNDWENAYYGEFSAHDGTRPLVVSYASSPPAEVIFAETPISESPTATITANQSCFRQIEFVGILRGTRNQAQARKWIDFMLSTQFQEDLPLQMFVYPVNQNAALPLEFVEFSSVPAETAVISSQDIAANREAWIRDWTEAVLR
ncbi:MAG TPA: thiamine ABC transporter substrate-binding protein [Anaerolineales bacterium]|nr:thiamine ABC transporter substrate-binding protein [Anaerolineales bacterium]